MMKANSCLETYDAIILIMMVIILINLVVFSIAMFFDGWQKQQIHRNPNLKPQIILLPTKIIFQFLYGKEVEEERILNKLEHKKILDWIYVFSFSYIVIYTPKYQNTHFIPEKETDQSKTIHFNNNITKFLALYIIIPRRLKLIKMIIWDTFSPRIL